jgi:spore coat polysaccharide biosynthesis predicted glycosyltransferase SpsG
LPEKFLPFLQMISGPEFDRVCVMTPSSASDEALMEWATCQPEIHELCHDFAAFPGRLAEASAVISGGGTTLWEVYALGKPSLAIVWVDNQRQTLQVVESCGTGTVCDLRRGFEPDASGEAWKRFLSTLNDAAMVERQRELIDGCGAERVAEYLQGLIR